MYWEEKYETMPREELEQLQLERLQGVVNRAYRNVKFYNEKFKEVGITPEDIKSLDDVRKLPFTTKDDLRDNYPYGMFAVPLRDIVRIHSSSGTTGKPTVVGYTRNDLDIWSNLVARIMVAGGVTKDDIIQISFGYGLFTGGFGLHYGAEKIGATVIPISSGNTDRQIMIMKDYHTTVLVCTPSYALVVADRIEELDIDPRSLSLRTGLFGAEPWSEGMREEIENKLKIKAYDNYGLSEIIGPGVAGECEEKNGMHIAEDHFFVEIIDPETGEPLPPGSEGELVITTLTKEALPLIRYRTRDITRLHYELCGCGRTSVRMEKVKGRSDDMLIIRGVNVFPSQIEEVLFSIEGTEPHYQIIVDRKNRLDTLTVLVEVSPEIFSDEMKKQRQIIEEIEEKLFSILGLRVEVKLVEPRTIQRFEGKAVRVIDNRKL